MKLQIKVPNMACSACGETITKAVMAITPDATVQADPKTKFVSIEMIASESAITEAIVSAGYTVVR
ncbi:MAG TPA: heavy-metal-associated domain-containing protein [Oculatellaceae cyanobacterium]|jgi:copper chaperone